MNKAEAFERHLGVSVQIAVPPVGHLRFLRPYPFPIIRITRSYTVRAPNVDAYSSFLSVQPLSCITAITYG